MGRAPTRLMFTLFDVWAASADHTRRAIARGQALFNERALGTRRLTCSGCHNAPNVGSSSTGALFKGVSGQVDRALPLYTLLYAALSEGPVAGRTLQTIDSGWGW